MAKNKKAMYQIYKLQKKLNQLESERKRLEKKRVIKDFLIWVGMERDQQNHQRYIWKQHYLKTRKWVLKTKHLQLWNEAMTKHRFDDALKIAKVFKKALINHPDKRPQKPPYPDGIEMDFSSTVKRYQQVMDEIQHLLLQIEEIKSIESVSDDGMQVIEVIT